MTDIADALSARFPRFDTPLPSDADLSTGEEFIQSLANQPLRDGTHLRAVAAARKVVEEAEALLVESIKASLAAGDSWTMIGLALRTSKQNAHRKYASRVGEAAPSPAAQRSALNGAVDRVAHDVLSFVAIYDPTGQQDGEVVPNENSRHVVPGKHGGWDVIRPGSDRVSSHHEKQSDAIDRGREIIRNAGGGELSIHDRNGQIRAKGSVPPGSDPRRSKR